MTFRIKKNETVSQALKRVVHEQLANAINSLHSDNLHEGVHDARKRFKKVRALLRLVRDEIGEDFYKKENIIFRDAGRQLSDLRDASSKIETLEKLKESYKSTLKINAFSEAENSLRNRRKGLSIMETEEKNTIEKVIKVVEEAMPRVDHWPIARDSFDALAPGFRRTYKRGKKALETVNNNPSPENFHEWRKRTKYLRYQLKFLRPVWEEVVKKYNTQAAILAESLGNEHDLSLLYKDLNENKIDFKDPHNKSALENIILERRENIRQTSLPLGERIYFDEKEMWINRFRTFWNARKIELGQLGKKQ